MADNNFKVDIGGMRSEIEGVVRVVEELTKSLEKLGLTSQNAFSAVNKSIGVASGAPVGVVPLPDAMITSEGADKANNTENSNKAFKKNLRVVGASQQDPNQEDLPYQIRSIPGNKTQYSVHAKPYGTILRPINNTQQSNANQAPVDVAAQTASNKPEFNQPNPIIETRRAAFGYGASDLAKLVGKNQDIAGMDKQLGELSKTLSASNDDMHKTVSRLQEDLKLQYETFKSTLKDYNTATPEDEKRAWVDLTHAMEKLTGKFEEANNVTKQLATNSGNASGGGFSDETKMMARRYLPALAGIAGAGVIGYMQSDLGFQQATARKGLESLQTEGQITQMSFQAQSESADMTKAENLLKYQGDILSPGRYKYLGKDGIERAKAEATRMEEQQKSLLESQRNLGMASVLKDVAMGAGIGAVTGFAAGGVGAIPGALIGAGAGMITGGFSANKDYYTNPLTLAEGKLKGSLTQKIFGISDQAADEAQIAAKREMQAQQYQDYRALQEAEIQNNPEAMAGLNEFLSRQQAQQRAASLVGQYAPDAKSLDFMSTGGFTAGVKKQRQDIAIAKQSLSQYQAKFEEKEALYREASKGGRGDFEKERAERDSAKKQFEAAQSTVAEATYRDVRSTSKSTPIYAQLGMSGAEFITAQGQLTNMLGGSEKASDTQTKKMLEYSKAGFGSYEQMLGQLGSMNQIAGGKDNTKRLEEVLTVAVGAGFDKSRMAQQFISTTNDLSRALNISSPESVSKTLSLTASVMSTTGAADEKSLSAAAQGIQGLAQVTGQGGGAFGALKLMGAYQGGLQLGQGAGSLQTSNLQQMLDQKSQLESTSDMSKITDPNLQNLIRLSGGKEQALKALQGSITGASAPMRGLLGMVEIAQKDKILKKYNVSSVDDFYKQAKDMQSKGGAKYQDYLGDVKAIGAGMEEIGNIPKGSGEAYSASMVSTVGKISARSFQADLDKAKAKGLRMAVTPAQENLQNYISDLYGKEMAGMEEKKVTSDELKKIQKDMPEMIPRLSDKTDLTAERLAELEKDPESKLYKEAQGKLSRIEMAQQAGYTLAGMKGEQRVWVTNIRDIAMFMKDIDKTSGAKGPSAKEK